MGAKRQKSLWLLGVVALFAFLSPSIAELSHVDSMIQDALAAVEEPVVVNRTNGSQFSGEFSGIIEDGFIMTQRVGLEGSVEVEIKWNDVESVQFAGDAVMGEIPDLFEMGEFGAVIDVMSALFEQRSPFFRLMTDVELKPFQYLARSYLNQSRPVQALGVIRSMKSFSQESTGFSFLEETELLAYLMLNLDQEAVELAKNKIELANDPSTVSLCWIALSLYHLSNGDYRQAWLCSVHPMLFDRNPDASNLADAYLLAMVATLKLNRPVDALRYHNAFKQLQLTVQEKPYQQLWFEFFMSIDWQELAQQTATIERFADIQSKLSTPTTINPSSIPIPRIPLSNL